MKPLTRKQAAILEQISEGKRIDEIAEAAGMSESAAHQHVQRAKVKLGARTTAQLVVLYDRMKREDWT